MKFSPARWGGGGGGGINFFNPLYATVLHPYESMKGYDFAPCVSVHWFLLSQNFQPSGNPHFGRASTTGGNKPTLVITQRNEVFANKIYMFVVFCIRLCLHWKKKIDSNFSLACSLVNPYRKSIILCVREVVTHLHIVSYFINWVTTSWTHSTNASTLF